MNKKHKNDFIDIVILILLGIIFNFIIFLEADIFRNVFLRILLSSINNIVIFYKMFKASFIKKYILDLKKLNNKRPVQYEIIFNKDRKLKSDFDSEVSYYSKIS